MVDDLGVNDLGINNPRMQTPSIDRLAGEGVYFRRHYVDSTCTATRVGIMTGIEPARLGFNPAHQGISPEEDTLPELLRDAGYATHHIGKWHLGFTTALALPTAQGFHTFYGFLDQMLLGGPPARSPRRYRRPRYENPWLQSQAGEAREVAGHLTDILADRAVTVIENAAASAGPWFVNLWFYAPHTPIQPAPRFASLHADTPEGRYRALVQQLDAAVGQVLEQLDRLGLGSNTLVLLASDNGGTNRQMDNNHPFTGSKMTFLEGGVRTPLIVRWPGVLPAGQQRQDVVSYLDYLPTLVAAAGWDAGKAYRGRDLFAFRQGSQDDRETMYWQALTMEGADSWAVLSEDRRWRLSQFYIGEPVLNDLDSDPDGANDVLPANPGVADDLLQKYRDWRAEASRVFTGWEAGPLPGQWRLTGSSLQRSPGYGPHTLAIGLTRGDGALPQESWQLAAQGNLWGMEIAGTRITVRVNGLRVEAEAPMLAEAGCHTLVLASHFYYSRLTPDKDRGWLSLYIDGVQLGQDSQLTPPLPPDDWHMPALFGPVAGSPPAVAIGRPLISSHSLYRVGERRGELEAMLGSLGEEACPGN